MPGYSDYLHPLNATHVLGLGMGGTAAGRINGVKLALFDASNVEAPDIAFATEVGGPGSHSAATDDHKAFLFDASRRLLTLPISVATEQGAACSAESANHWSQWRHTLWQGMLTWRVTEASFELLGAVSHYDPAAETYLEREVDTPPSWSYPSSGGRGRYDRSNRCGYAEHAWTHLGLRPGRMWLQPGHMHMHMHMHMYMSMPMSICHVVAGVATRSTPTTARATAPSGSSVRCTWRTRCSHSRPRRSASITSPP